MNRPTPPRRAGLSGLRLRSRLALFLSVAALLPLAVVSTVSVQLALGGLDLGVRAGTSRTLRVGLNLVLERLRDLQETADGLGSDPRIAERLAHAQAGDPGAPLSEILAEQGSAFPEALVELSDGSGRIVARRSRGRDLSALRLVDGAKPIRRALGYGRRVTLDRAGGLLVMRAAAPVIDASFRLRGAVVLTVPLDAVYADRLKASLASDVVLYADDRPVASSLVGEGGRRSVGFALPEGAATAAARGTTFVTEGRALGRSWSIGFAPLVDLDGRQLGVLGVATSSDAVDAARARSWQSVVIGGLAGLALALVLAALAARALTRPLARLHESARAVARGELDRPIPRESGDEIGDVAEAFAQMTLALRTNQERLAARMRELEILQDIGRAVSSVLGLDEVLHRVVDQLSGVLAADQAALLYSDDSGSLQVGARVGLGDEFPLRQLCQLLYWWDGPLLLDDVDSVPELRDAARAVGIRGSILAVPLEQKDDVLGLLLVSRVRAPLSDGDLRLVASFADHAATAIHNARLYEALQRASEDLERKVADRTAELTLANRELSRVIAELSEAQSQLVLSDRMAGLGVLVSGIAHEINSPSGAIQGAIDLLGDNLEGLVQRARGLAELRLTPVELDDFHRFVEGLGPRLVEARLPAPAPLRKSARELAERLAAEGVPVGEGDLDSCKVLIEIGADDDASLAQLAPLARAHGLAPLCGYLDQHAFLYRNVQAVRLAVRRITRIVGALKGYSHLDQARAAPADLHEGIENTLVILHHELARGIVVNRHFSALPPIPVFVDELNQVWTNLIHNAVQALDGPGEIAIATQLAGDVVEVTIEDDGPGIPAEALPRIFEPFFTTKRAGEGTGLGLGIVRRIVDKHGGRVEVTSRPGRTRFTVSLPVAGPPRPEAAPADEGLARG